MSTKHGITADGSDTSDRRGGDIVPVPPPSTSSDGPSKDLPAGSFEEGVTAEMVTRLLDLRKRFGVEVNEPCGLDTKVPLVMSDSDEAWIESINEAYYPTEESAVEVEGEDVLEMDTDQFRDASRKAFADLEITRQVRCKNLANQDKRVLRLQIGTCSKLARDYERRTRLHEHLAEKHQREGQSWKNFAKRIYAAWNGLAREHCLLVERTAPLEERYASLEIKLGGTERRRSQQEDMAGKLAHDLNKANVLCFRKDEELKALSEAKLETEKQLAEERKEVSDLQARIRELESTAGFLPEPVREVVTPPVVISRGDASTMTMHPSVRDASTMTCLSTEEVTEGEGKRRNRRKRNKPQGRTPGGPQWVSWEESYPRLGRGEPYSGPIRREEHPSGAPPPWRTSYDVGRREEHLSGAPPPWRASYDAVRREETLVGAPPSRRIRREESLSRAPPPWRIVPPSRRRRTRGTPPPQHPVVAIRVEDTPVGTSSYAEILRDVKRKIPLKDLGIGETSIRRAADGGLLVEVRDSVQGGKKADALAERLKALLPSASIRRPVRLGRIRLVGFDESVLPGDIQEDLAALTGCGQSDIKVGQIFWSPRGIGAVTVRLPLAAACVAARAGKVALGWSSARIELRAEGPLQCHRCWEYGHTRAGCTGTDRGSRCYNCGGPGHAARDCADRAQCAVCLERGWEARHRMGGPSCRASREARAAGPPSRRSGRWTRGRPPATGEGGPCSGAGCDPRISGDHHPPSTAQVIVPRADEAMEGVARADPVRECPAPQEPQALKRQKRGRE